MSSNVMNQLRAILDHFDGTDRSHVLMFFRVVYCAGPEAVQEIIPRVTLAAAPKPLRHLAMEASYYHPWPEWLPMLVRLLRHELDLQTFQVGIQALGRIGGADALTELRLLSTIRSQPGFQECVAMVLAETDPEEAFSHHITGLMEGSSNPSVANEAARQLGELLSVDSLEPLKVLMMHPDLLVFRHVLRLIARIPSREAAAFVAQFIKDCHAEIVQDRLLKETIGSLRSHPAPEVAESARAQLAELVGARDENARSILEAGRPTPAAIEILKPLVSGPVEGLLLALLGAAADNKGVRFPSIFVEASEEMHLRARRQSFTMDVGAECLARMVKTGLMPVPDALAILSEALRAQVGRDGLARALATLVPAEDAELLDLLVLNPDSVVRSAALEILGDRMEEALRPALLKICRDPISDMALRTLFHLGRLPGAEEQATRMLDGGKPEDIQTGLRFIGMHKLKALLERVLAMVGELQREDLVLEALEAIGGVGAAEAAEPLLALFHSGLNSRLQVAYAQSIRDLRDRRAADALAQKVQEFRNPVLHTVAVEALAAAHGPDAPMDPEGASRLETQVRAGWKDNNPWPLRMRILAALETAEVHDPPFWIRMNALLTEAMAEKRSQTALSPDDLARIQAVGRLILQRSAP
jgi:HEAT repeat protein